MAERDSDEGSAQHGLSSSRQWTPFGITTAVAIPLLAIVVSVIIAVTTSSSGGPKPTAATSPTATPATPIPLLDSCLFGVWIQQDHLPDRIILTDGSIVKPVTRTGGISLHFGSDGHGSTEFGMQLTGTHQGSPVEVDLEGTDAFTYTVRDATLQFVRTTNNAQQVLYVGHQKTFAKPLNGALFSDQITCTPAHLTLVEADGAWHYDRP
ncbi:hypothetical protein NE236_25010 [Actinoallomurus purpureus]|uniref:hypothetical protein n=1 Tax=Actinoallomurus purpureus TaxID=478114 RepID=UPI00209282E4|nr:hypothetical protein [Actinoallomurus purpureus]MCO6008242.1 hypothetical protein [Actinoallomurus purpureus]